jgi:rhodanese-related sulfurtransferase
MLDSGETLFLLNPLPSLLFRQGHIPGSVNIRWHSLDTSPLMPVDKNTPIVTYCMGPR